MDELDELDIDLQGPDDIGSRVVLLSSLALLPTLDDRERARWTTWLQREGVLELATPAELDLLETRAGDNGDEEDVSADSAEALIPLAWSVGLFEELPARASPETLKFVMEAVPMPPERVEPFLNGLILLNEETIALERERAEIWEWRMGAELRRRQTHGVAMVEVTEAIREVVLEAATSMVIAENDGIDLLVEGVRVMELEPPEVGELLMVTQERLRALNWVCGLTEWDQIDIDD
jgi:hypothetical protein